MGMSRSEALRRASKRYKEQQKQNSYINKQLERFGLSAPPERWKRVGRYRRTETPEYKKWYQEYSKKVKETIGITPDQALAKNKYAIAFDPNGNMIIRDGKPSYIRSMGGARPKLKADPFNAVQQELYYYDRKQAAKKKAEEMYNKKILEGKTLLAQEQSKAINQKQATQKTLLGGMPASMIDRYKEVVKRRKDKSVYKKNKSILGGIERLNNEETLG